MKLVELTSRGLRDLKKIKSFNKELYGGRKAQEIIDVVFKELELLEATEIDFTTVGSVDEQFEHLRYEYRKLIVKHYKITYRVGRKKIYVVRVFDTRQKPSKNL